MSLSVAARDPKPGQDNSSAGALPSSLPTSRSYLIIGLLWGLIYFAGMFTPALLDDVDTIHAEAAREMLVRHDWVTMYTDGIRYLEKAPLMYWSLASSYTLFGISDWSTRLPLMLGVLALLFATYGLGRFAYGELFPESRCSGGPVADDRILLFSSITR
jgi:4-amino-4-deoxy-L-arabinose transferase-like glycosyltransferase